jgi:hypothetical protein
MPFLKALPIASSKNLPNDEFLFWLVCKNRKKLSLETERSQEFKQEASPTLSSPPLSHENRRVAFPTKCSAPLEALYKKR